jgi:hypothetical protein
MNHFHINRNRSIIKRIEQKAIFKCPQDTRITQETKLRNKKYINAENKQVQGKRKIN